MIACVCNRVQQLHGFGTKARPSSLLPPEWWYLQRPGCRNAAICNRGLDALKQLVLRCRPSRWRGSQGSAGCLVPGQCKPHPASLTWAGPMLPEVLTCHGSDVVAWLQAVRCRHDPFLVDDGCAAEAHAVAVHQMNLREQKEITLVGLCKSVRKKSGTLRFCLAMGWPAFRSYRPSAARDDVSREFPAPLSTVVTAGSQHRSAHALVPHCTSPPFAARLGGQTALSVNLSIKLGTSKIQALLRLLKVPVTGS